MIAFAYLVILTSLVGADVSCARGGRSLSETGAADALLATLANYGAGQRSAVMVVLASCVLLQSRLLAHDYVASLSLSLSPGQDVCV